MDPIQADELLAILMRFHREIALPDIVRTIRDPIDARISALEDEMLTNFEAIQQRFDRLERLEER